MVAVAPRPIDFIVSGARWFVACWPERALISPSEITVADPTRIKRMGDSIFVNVANGHAIYELTLMAKVYEIAEQYEEAEGCYASPLAADLIEGVLY